MTTKLDKTACILRVSVEIAEYGHGCLSQKWPSSQNSYSMYLYRIIPVYNASQNNDYKPLLMLWFDTKHFNCSTCLLKKMAVK